MNLSPLLRLLLLTLLLCGYNSLQAQVNRFTLKSPDSKVAATLYLSNGTLYYRINYLAKPVIEASRMGLQVNEVAYTGGRSMYPSPDTIIKNRFAWRGVHNTAYHYARQATIRIGNDASGGDWKVDMQVFNDGVAFRYLIPHRGAAKIDHEFTTFTVPEAAEAWWQGDVQNYEGTYTNSQPAAIKKGQSIGLPITLALPQKQGYLAITEANVNNFAGMHLTATGTPALQTAFDGDVNLTGDVTTPWRVIMIGQDLNTLMNNDMVASLSPKADPDLFPLGFDTPWIMPGKSVWSWMTANRSVTPENMRRFTDWAAQCGIPYNLVDDGWGKWNEPGKDHWQLMKELVEYSEPKNVKIWVWAAYPDNNGIPGLKDSTYLVSFLKRCHEIGVAGVKIDFMSSESQNMVAFYNRASREAAKQHLMIDFHGASKPSGQSRTWPNELSREAVRGLEYSDDTDWPSHNTIIPFTRYLAGHGDYTPLSMAKFVSSTTLAHQVATMAVFTSPFLCLGIDPGELLKSEALPFVKAIPSVWQQTVVLPQSAIGQVCVIARRSGSRWFLAVLNNKQAKTINVPLSFLPNRNYRCRALGNTENTRAINGKVFTQKDSINITLTSGDGLVALLEP